MKKNYNSPKVEYTAFIRSNVICASGDGAGIQDDPNKDQGGTGDAPKRRVF